MLTLLRARPWLGRADLYNEGDRHILRHGFSSALWRMSDIMGMGRRIGRSNCHLESNCLFQNSKSG